MKRLLPYRHLITLRRYFDEAVEYINPDNILPFPEVTKGKALLTRLMNYPRFEEFTREELTHLINTMELFVGEGESNQIRLTNSVVRKLENMRWNLK